MVQIHAERSASASRPADEVQASRRLRELIDGGFKVGSGRACAAEVFPDHSAPNQRYPSRPIDPRTRMPGSLFIIAAPSGGGKTSLVKALLARERQMALSVSYTSRGPRPGEVDGVHYHFVDRARFEQMAARGEFFEYFVVHGDLKGTARTAVEPLLAAGTDVLLEIDWQGARKVREQVPDCVGVFILPPSTAELERRLRHRAQDSEQTIRRRLANSREEMRHAGEFDFVIVNQDFDVALEDLLAIVRSQRVRTSVQRVRIDGLVAQLTTGP